MFLWLETHESLQLWRQRSTVAAFPSQSALSMDGEEDEMMMIMMMLFRSRERFDRRGRRLALALVASP
jgi:hypothetical protein